MSAPIRSRFLTGTPVEEHGLLMPVPWIGLPADASTEARTARTSAQVALDNVTASDAKSARTSAQVALDNVSASDARSARTSVQVAIALLRPKVGVATETERAGTAPRPDSGPALVDPAWQEWDRARRRRARYRTPEANTTRRRRCA